MKAIKRMKDEGKDYFTKTTATPPGLEPRPRGLS